MEHYEILRVDLTAGTANREVVPEELMAAFVGGKGLAAHYLATEMPAGADPLGPDNLLIFMTGPTSGIFPGTCRHAVVTKSPATGGFLDTYAGGYLAWELRRAGLLGVIVKGSADHPVYLTVDDGEAALHDATDLAGKSIVDGRRRPPLRRLPGGGHRPGRREPRGHVVHRQQRRAHQERALGLQRARRGGCGDGSQEPQGHRGARHRPTRRRRNRQGTAQEPIGEDPGPGLGLVVAQRRRARPSSSTGPTASRCSPRATSPAARSRGPRVSGTSRSSPTWSRARPATTARCAAAPTSRRPKAREPSPGSRPASSSTRPSDWARRTPATPTSRAS